MDEQVSRLGAQPFLRGLRAEYLDRLADLARHVSLPTRHRLFDEGGIADKFWLIEAGQVALDMLVPGQGRITIEMLGRGDVIGLSWLQQPYQWRYGAITTQPLHALEFDARAVRQACSMDSAFGYALVTRFMAVTAHRLQATRARLIDAHGPRPSATAEE